MPGMPAMLEAQAVVPIVTERLAFRGVVEMVVVAGTAIP